MLDSEEEVKQWATKNPQYFCCYILGYNLHKNRNTFPNFKDCLLMIRVKAM